MSAEETTKIENYNLDLISFTTEYLNYLGQYNTSEFDRQSLKKYKKQLKKIKGHLKKVDKSLLTIKDTNIRLFVGVGASQSDKLILLNILKLLEINIMLKIFQEI